MRTIINTSVKMPPALHARVQSLAEIRQRTPHAVMLQAIETYIDREEKRENLRQAARAAHDDYMQTGLHLTNAEVMTWLKELGTGSYVEPPQCHI